MISILVTVAIRLCVNVVDTEVFIVSFKFFNKHAKEILYHFVYWLLFSITLAVLRLVSYAFLYVLWRIEICLVSGGNAENGTCLISQICLITIVIECLWTCYIHAVYALHAVEHGIMHTTYFLVQIVTMVDNSVAESS